MIKTFDQWVEGSQDAQQFDLTQELQKALEDALAKGDQATADKYQNMLTQMAQRQRQPKAKAPRQSVEPPLQQTSNKYTAPDPRDFPIGAGGRGDDLQARKLGPDWQKQLHQQIRGDAQQTKQGWLAKLKGLFGG